jgi:hypothetical protein
MWPGHRSLTVMFAVAMLYLLGSMHWWWLDLEKMPVPDWIWQSDMGLASKYLVWTQLVSTGFMLLVSLILSWLWTRWIPSGLDIWIWLPVLTATIPLLLLAGRVHGEMRDALYLGLVFDGLRLGLMLPVTLWLHRFWRARRAGSRFAAKQYEQSGRMR